ncbi:Virulence sensor protein BvgS [Pseudomonas fluorescens]|nr:Virulence sensor protein BvgS [Pseudomonas fluorescens]
MVGTANDYDRVEGIKLTRAYAEDQPTLVTRRGESQLSDASLQGKRVAMLYHYLPLSGVRKFYPRANIQLYSSMLSAIGAVAFGQADIYLGDAISANYLINKNYLNNIQLTDFSRMEVGNFCFAVSSDNTRLLRILNTGLEAVPADERMAVSRRWSGGVASMLASVRVQFSESEQAWMGRHPRVRVAVMDNYPPLSFVDEEGRFRGISADVLARISLRTGIKFEPVNAGSLENMVERVVAREADLAAAIMPTTVKSETFLFTRPYLTTPLVLVVKNGLREPRSMNEVGHGPVALLRSSAVRAYLEENFPATRVLDVDSTSDALKLVATGKALATVNALASMNYMIAEDYGTKLDVVSTVGVEPGSFAFAMRQADHELLSILDKALLSITPEEMDEITGRWRSERITHLNFWSSHRTAIVQGFVIAAALLLLALLWIAHLRHLVRKREEVQRELNDQLAFQRVLIDGTPHPIYVRDRQGKMVICNTSYLQTFQRRREDVIGKTVMEMELEWGDAVQAARYHDDYMRVMERGEASTGDRFLRLASGELLTIYHWMLPYRDSDGKVLGMIAGWVDISDRQRLMDQLQEAKERADDANKAKTTFLATMSHEIRTPMNAVLGMLELAMKRANEGVLDYLAIEVASGAAQGLLSLIGDILDIARIESGKLGLVPARCNLARLTESTARVFEGLARDKRLRLEVDIADAVDRDVLIDPLRYKQILSNLLSNSIKFTEQGSVKVALTCAYQVHQDSALVTLRIEDTGVGISINDQARLFEAFSQASNVNPSSRVGAGLGLLISRNLSEMMQGSLTLTSTPHVGTTVVVKFNAPCLASDHVALQPVVRETSVHKSLRILIVDDYPANRLLLSQQLTYLGHRVTDAADGADGLQAWLKGSFNVVISDCSMPVMDGYQLTRAIRREEAAANRHRTLILGFTANAQREELERCLEAGMDGCLFKPISLDVLAMRLSTLTPILPVLDTAVDELLLTGGLDLGVLSCLGGTEQAEVRELLTDLASSNKQDRKELVSLLMREDIDGLGKLAHRIRGGARIIRETSLDEACAELESACQAPIDPERVADAVENLDTAMASLAGKLKPYIL